MSDIRQANFEMPTDVLAALKVYADREHLSQKWVVTEVLRDFLIKEGIYKPRGLKCKTRSKLI